MKAPIPTICSTCAGDEGDVAAPQWPAELLMSWFRGQRCPFPLGASPGESACAAAQRPGRSGSAAIPSGARGRGRARTRRRRKGKRCGERDKAAD
jgi:hypothetical protein